LSKSCDVVGVLDGRIAGIGVKYCILTFRFYRSHTFTTFEFVDTNTLAPGISKNETVMANPPLLALAVSVNAGCYKGTPSAMKQVARKRVTH